MVADPIDLDEARRARTDQPAQDWSHDMYMHTEFPVPRALITGVLDEGSLNSWSGPGGVGKSLVALDAARSIAGCQKFLGEFITVQGPVVLIDQESSPAMLQRRLIAMQRAQAIPANSPFQIVIPTDPILLDSEAGYEVIDGYLRRFKPVLLILDSLTRFHRADENSAGEMADLGAILRRLIQDHGTAIILIDHSRKPGVVDDRASRLRGSTEKRNMLDTALDFQTPKPDEPLVVTMTKRRWAEAVAPFAVRIVAEDGGLQVVHDGAAARADRVSGNKVIEAVRALIAADGPDAADVKSVAAEAGIADRTAREQLARCVKAGTLTAHEAAPGPSGGRPGGLFRMAADHA